MYGSVCFWHYRYLLLPTYVCVGENITSFRRHLRTYGFENLGDGIFSNSHFKRGSYEDAVKLQPRVPLSLLCEEFKQPEGVFMSSYPAYPSTYGSDGPTKAIGNLIEIHSRQVCFPVISIGIDSSNPTDTNALDISSSSSSSSSISNTATLESKVELSHAADSTEFDEQFNDFLNSIGADESEFEVLSASVPNFRDIHVDVGLDERTPVVDSQGSFDRNAAGSCTTGEHQIVDSSNSQNSDSACEVENDSGERKRQRTMNNSLLPASDECHVKNDSSSAGSSSSTTTVTASVDHGRVLRSKTRMSLSGNVIGSPSGWTSTNDNVNIGPLYQATIPALLPPLSQEVKLQAMKDNSCSWSPMLFDDDKVESFINFVKTETVSASIRTRVKVGSLLVVKKNKSRGAFKSTLAVVKALQPPKSNGVDATLFDGKEVSVHTRTYVHACIHTYIHT